MAGGKYQINIDDYEKFKKLYLRSYPKFTKTTGTQLIPKNGGVSPIFIDIDLRLTEITSIPDQVFIDLAQEIVKQMDIDVVEAVLTRRVAAYTCTKGKKAVIKHGFHIYISEKRNRQYQMDLREKCLKNIDWSVFDRYNNMLQPKDIYDSALAKQSNGLMMIGDRKVADCTPHYIFFSGRWDAQKLTHDKRFSYTESVAVLKKIFDHMYSWIWERQPEPVQDIRVAIKQGVVRKRPCQDDEKSAAHAVPTQQTISVEKSNLVHFLDAFPQGWVPDNECYCQIVYYFTNMNLDPAQTCDLLNKQWGYADRETQRMMEKATSLPKVSLGSMIRILDRHGKPGWKRDDIFGNIPKEKQYQFFNEVAQFTEFHRINKLEDIYQFFNDVIAYTWSDSTTRFVYKETHEKRDYDRPIQVVNVCVTTKSPFNEFSDRLVKCELTVEETIARLCSELDKPKRPKDGTSEDLAVFEGKQKFVNAAFALIKKVKKEQSEESTLKLRKLLQDMLGEEIACKERRLGELFLTYHQRGRLERYYTFDCVPYSLHGDPTPKHTLNVFQGYPLSKVTYTPVDIKQTAIWQWLWIAWANRSDYKMNWLLNALAVKLQKPAKKLCKFIVAYSIETGSGKTTMRYFLQALFDSVFFCEALKNLTGEFSSQQLGKQWCIIDDVEKLTKSQSAALKGRITSNTFEYRKMYSDPIRMNCYMDLIASSNSPNPIFIGTNDRRSELVEINPELKGNREFWDRVYDEFKSTDIMASWYHVLLGRDLTGVSFGEQYRFSHDAIASQKVQNLRSAYRFLMTYFERSDWVMNETAVDRRTYAFAPESIDEHMRHSGDDLVITTTKLFEYYTRWVKLCRERNCLKMQNFYSQLVALGIRKTRQNMRGVRKSVFILNEASTRELIARHLSVEPRYVEFEWVINAFQPEDGSS